MLGPETQQEQELNQQFRESYGADPIQDLERLVGDL